jgi:hypothetical protein
MYQILKILLGEKKSWATTIELVNFKRNLILYIKYVRGHDTKFMIIHSFPLISIWHFKVKSA